MDYNNFRMRILDELDKVYDACGVTPNHIIVSREIYCWLDAHNKFEQLKDKSDPRRPGFIGMKVWWSDSLDARNRDALLLNRRALEKIAPVAADYS